MIFSNKCALGFGTKVGLEVDPTFHPPLKGEEFLRFVFIRNFAHLIAKFAQEFPPPRECQIPPSFLPEHQLQRFDLERFEPQRQFSLGNLHFLQVIFHQIAFNGRFYRESEFDSTIC